MKMYLTEHALKVGIQEFDAEEFEVPGLVRAVGSGRSSAPEWWTERYGPQKPFFFAYTPGGNCFESLDEAIADAERRRKAAIDGLLAQIAELEKIRFDVPSN